MSLLLATPSASLTPVLPVLSSRGLSSTLATARGALMLPLDTELATESPSPPPLRTATTCTDMSLLPVTPSASLTPVLPDLSSRGLSSIPATARGPLMPMLTTVPSPLLRTATMSTATSSPPSTPSASPTPASADLTSRSLVSTLASTTVATTARGPLSPSTEEWLSTPDMLFLPLRGLLRVLALDMATATATAMVSTATARGPLTLTTELLPLPTLSTRPTLVTLDLTSRCLAFTPGSATATEATSTKD